MTESVRRRTSKWDLKEERNDFRNDIREDKAWSEKASESTHGQGSKSHIGVQRKDDSRRSYYESSPGDRVHHKDADFSRYSHETKSRWVRGESYSMSPGIDRWRRRSRSYSRSRSRSRSYSRSRSPRNGWNRSRSRSRSPSRGFRRESEGRYDRIRGGSGVTSQTCRDFVRGRCSRGSECRFLHQDDTDYGVRKHPGGDAAENWVGRHEKGGSSENNIERDYSRNKISHGHRDPYDESWEKHEAPRNSISSSLCNNFLKGKCYRGSSCIYIHDSSVADDHGRREWDHRNREADVSSGFDYKRETGRRINDVPCRFFASGNCRNGVSCRFSHETAAHDRPEEKSRDSRWGSNFGNENSSWGGSKWGSGATESAHSRVEERTQNVHRGQNLHNEDRSVGVPTWDEKAANTDVAKSQQWRNDANDVNMGDKANSWGGSKWSDNAADQGGTWGEKAVNTDVVIFQQGRNDANAENMGNKVGSWGGPKWNDNPADPGRTWGGKVVSADVTTFQQCRNDGLGENMGDKAGSWGGPKWTDNAADPGKTWGEKAVNPDVAAFQQCRNDGNGENMVDKAGLWGGPKLTDTADPERIKSPQQRNNDESVKGDPPVLQPTDRWGPNLDNQNRTFGAPLSDQPAGVDVHKPSQWVGDNNSGHIGNWVGHSNLSHGANMLSGEVKGSEYPHFTDNGGHHNQDIHSVGQKQNTLCVQDQTINQEVSSQGHASTVVLQPTTSENVAMQQTVSENMAMQRKISENMAMQPTVSENMAMQPTVSETMAMQPTVSEAMAMQQTVSETMAMQPTVSENVAMQQNCSLRENASTFNFGNSDGVSSVSKPLNHVNVSEGIHPGNVPMNGQNFIQRENLVNHPLSGFNVVGQGQQISPSPAPYVQTFDLNGPAHNMISHTSSSSHFHTPSQGGEPFKRSDTVDPRMMPINSGTPLGQKIVTSEQVAQISNLSASLAHIFAKGQQLPQLYATLNGSHSKGLLPSQPNSAGSLTPVLASITQPNQGIWSQRQFHPIGEGTNSVDISMHPPGFSLPNTVVQNKTGELESQTPIISVAPSSVIIAEPNNGDPSTDGGLAKRLPYQTIEEKVQPVNDEKVAEYTKKEKESAPSEDMNVDGSVDEESKKNKDAKGMRMFKFALVEFVKEILKPTWKEGQMSKEAHKTIVKKVVDKVTGSVPEIPQSQEKIDQYLSYSKSKLTKLVQAYVEKYLKS